MADLITRCPSCGEKFVIEKEWVGQECSCPSCNKAFIIELAPQSAPDPAAEIPQTRSAASAWKVIAGVLAAVFLVLLGIGGYVWAAKTNTQKTEAEKKQRAEAARRAEDEKQRREEAARKAEDEKRRKEIKNKLFSEYEAARQQNQQDKLFVWTPGEEDCCILLFRYDARLASWIDEMRAARSRLKQYNQQVSAAVRAQKNNDIDTVIRLYRSGLRNQELNSDMIMKQIMELSDRITSLSKEKELLVGLISRPVDGCMRKEISAGKYIIVYLLPQGGCSSFIFAKKESPVILECRNEKWGEMFTP